MSETMQRQAEEAQRPSNPGMAPQQQVVVVSEPKSMFLAYVLWLFLGMLGLHRIYLDRVNSGVTQLALGAIGWATVWFIIGIVPLAFLVGWLLVDLFLIPGMVREANQRRGIVE
jgi:TM2 domain-containing membrane protein YozV